MKKKKQEQSFALALDLEKRVQPKKIIDHSKDFWMNRKLQTTDIRNPPTLFFEQTYNKHGFSRFKGLKN